MHKISFSPLANLSPSRISRKSHLVANVLYLALVQIFENLAHGVMPDAKTRTAGRTFYHTAFFLMLCTSTLKLNCKLS
jgi:hypothetical protein